MKKNITGIILCGGKNSRMKGLDKAFLMKEGMAFIDIINSQIQNLVKETLFISNSDRFSKKGGRKVFKDILKVNSPLAGIHSGLANMTTDYGLILSCDIPFLKKETIEILIDEIEAGWDVIVPGHGSFYQPLCAVYSKKCVSKIEKLTRHNFLKVNSLFKDLKVKTVEYRKFMSKDSNLKSFLNINSPEDFYLYCL